mgnify:CR=1 FL=1|tara:strand:+ start:143 stop:337 length:195 start_codon:yes stop_codon:yes gene_type:complete
MDNGIILIAVLLVVLIYFIAQLPMKKIGATKEVVVVNRQYPMWNMPTGFARPLRRYPIFRRPYY